MDIAGAGSFDSFEVLGSGIAEMTFEAVAVELRSHFHHVAVAGGLGEDGSGGDAGDLAIAFYDGLGSTEERAGDSVSVDIDFQGVTTEGLDTSLHGSHAGMKDIEAVNFGWFDKADGPLGAGFDFGFQLFSVRGV